MESGGDEEIITNVAVVNAFNKYVKDAWTANQEFCTDNAAILGATMLEAEKKVDEMYGNLAQAKRGVFLHAIRNTAGAITHNGKELSNKEIIDNLITMLTPVGDSSTSAEGVS